VPAVEESSYITVDYAMISATLDDDLLLLKEAKDRPDWPNWKEAMDAKIMQLTKLGTYKLAILPSDHQAIACKWVYHIKHNHTGKIMKHKARLVVKGYVREFLLQHLFQCYHITVTCMSHVVIINIV
jgi:hypothetical protein